MHKGYGSIFFSKFGSGFIIIFSCVRIRITLTYIQKLLLLLLSVVLVAPAPVPMSPAEIYMGSIMAAALLAKGETALA